MKQIRILHVFGKLNIGGAESLVMELYRKIDRSKVQFDFVVHCQELCDYEQEIVALGGVIHRLPRFRGKNLIEYYNRWEALLSAHTYPVLHIHTTNIAFIALPVACRHEVPMRITHGHSASEENRAKKLLRFLVRPILLKCSTHQFAASGKAAAYLYGKRGAARAWVIPNAIDATAFRYSPETSARMREMLGYAADELVIGHVGRFHYAKNHRFLLQVFHELCQQRGKVRLLLVGSGDVLEVVKHQAQTLGISEKVTFTGATDTVSDYLQAMDFFVFPSFYEGLPCSVVEAQASGLSCIISDAITPEVALTSLVSFRRITDTPQEWAEEIVQRSGGVRADMTQEIHQAGFDIRALAEKMQQFYLQG